jgi:hypothetical protein
MSVQVAEGIGYLKEDVEAPLQRKGLLHQKLADGDTSDELHCDKEPFFPLPVFIKLDNVRVISEGNDFSFP